MLTRTRNRPTQEQRGLLETYVIIGLIGGFVVFNLFSSRELLEPPTIGKSSWPDSRQVSNETILSYSEFNPRLWTDRERIQFLVEVTESGKTNLKEALKSRKTPVGAATAVSGEQESPSWISPFVEFNETRIPRFFQVAQEWLGDGDRLNPRMVQDLVRTVKRALRQNAAKRRNKTSNTTQIEGDSFKAVNRYQNCAVVGSDVTSNKSYGEQIDSNDMVIRLNNVERSKRLAQLGNKTSLSFMNSSFLHRCVENCGCGSIHGQQVPTILFISLPEHLLQVATFQSLCKSPLLVTPSLFDALCAAIAKWYSVTNFLRTTVWGLSEWNLVYEERDFRYSSALQAVVLALGMCDHVNLFGIGGGPTADKQHYHTEDWKESWLHDYASEYRFYDDLVHSRKIPLLADAGISFREVRIFR